MKKKIITNPFLNGYETMFLFGDTKEYRKQMIDFLNFNESYITDIEVGVYSYNGNKGILFISEEYNDIEVILHEVTHLVQELLTYLNIDSGINNTELVANLMAYYGKEALGFYKNFNG